MSASSGPSASLTSSRHSYPSMSARQHNPRRQSSHPDFKSHTSVQTPHSRAHGHCSIPEDSETGHSDKSVVVVGSSNQWVRDVNKEKLPFTSEVSSPLMSSSHTDCYDDNHQRTQNHTSSHLQAWDSSGASSEFNSHKAPSSTTPHVQHLPINSETTPLSSDASATNEHAGLSVTQPPFTSSCYPPRIQDSRPAIEKSLLSSATPSLYSQSRLQDDDIIGSIELGSSLASMSFNNLPYANLSEGNRSDSQPTTGGMANHSHQNLSYPHGHHMHSQNDHTHSRNNNYQSKDRSSSSHRPYSNTERRTAGQMSSQLVRHSHDAMEIEHERRSTSETSSSNGLRTRTMSESLPIQPEAMARHGMKNPHGIEFASLQQSKVYRGESVGTPPYEFMY